MGFSLIVRSDKSNGIRRRRVTSKSCNMLQLLNLFVALLLFSHSSLFPITLQTLSHLYHTLLPLFHNTFYAFLLLNTIILFLFALSNHNLETAPHEQKQQQPPRTLLTNINISDSESQGETLSVSEKKSYRRVQSESYERRMTVAAPAALGELKRCNSTTRGLKRPLQCVEQLSEDEFNRAVEDFIAKHKRMQWEEQIRSHKTESLACPPSN